MRVSILPHVFARPLAFNALGRLVLLTFACLGLTVSASAQNTKSSSSTERFTSAAFGPGEPKGTVDSVNHFNGHVSANLPVFTFGGRGDVGYTAYVTVNRTWDIHHIQTWSAPGQFGGQWSQPRYSLTSEGFHEDLSRAEVKPGLRPGVVFVRKLRDRSPDPSPASGEPGCNTLSKLYFRTGTGDIEFRDAGTNGLDKPMVGLSKFNRGKVWESRDGTAMTFVSDTDILDESCGEADYASMNGVNVQFPSGYLYAKNGVRYRVVSGEVVWMRDRNGNLLTLTPGNTIEERVVTDPAGRKFTIQTYVWAGAFQNQYVHYKGSGGAQRTVSAAYTFLTNALRQDAIDRGGVKTLGQHFTYILWEAPNTSFNPIVLSEVTLADGQKYKFKYNEFGELARIEHPNGSIVEFDYVPIGINNGETLNSPPQINRRVSVRRYYDREGVLGGTTTYQRMQEAPGEFATRVKVFDANNNLLTYTKHYTGLVENDYNLTGWYPPYNDGKEYRTEECDAAGNVLVRVDDTWVPNVHSTVLLGEEKTTLVPSNLVRKVSYSYDSYANLTDTYTYDYGTGDAGGLLSRTHTDYVPDAAYTARTGAHLRTLTRQSWTSTDAYGFNKVALSDAEYDDYTPDPANGNRHASLLPRSSITGLCLNLDAGFNCTTPSDSSHTTRGNVTARTQYLLANDGSTTGSVTANFQYDVAGNTVKTIDARRKPDGSGYETNYDFQDRYGTPDEEVQGNTVPAELAQSSATLTSFAYPTAVTNALGQTSYAQYDYYTGHMVNTEDPNGMVSNTLYGDALERPTRTERAVNVPALHSQTTIEYDDVNRTVTTTSDLVALNDNRLKGVVLYNGLGLTVETRQYETDTQYIATLTKYDALGRETEVSNPYRPTLSETPVWTKTAYDTLGRATSVITPDNATIYMLYDGLRTLITDQAFKQRVSKVNVFGDLTDLWEVVSPTSTDPGAEEVTFPVPEGLPFLAPAKGYRTSYSYDLLNNLRKVEQGGQQRYFAYDSLGRLLRVKHPEQVASAALALPANMLSPQSDNTNAWSLKYDYDEMGNLKVRTDSRGGGVSTTYTYDGLNRVTFADYSDSTPDVTYAYDDAAVDNSKGRVTAISTGSTVYSYTAYDKLGRVRATAQTTGGVTYSMPDYQYDLAGNLTSEQYPSGRVIKTRYDSAGRVAGVKDQAAGLYYAGGDPGVVNNPNVISYAANGVAADLRLGNGLWEHTSFNLRFQPEHIYLGSTKGGNSHFGLAYVFGTTNNNGNVRGMTITVPGVSTPYVQTYEYDELNRVSSGQELNQQLNGATPIWQQVFAYDRYGNRTLTTGTTIPAALDAINNPAVSNTTNRITSAGHFYDSAGNLRCDAQRQCGPGTNASNVDQSTDTYFSYDAENRLTRAGAGGVGAQSGGADYVYDGSGRRVKKVVGAVATVYVYDAAGSLVAEYGGEPPLTSGTSYITSDYMGSTRVITGQNPNDVRGRYDYLPFGEELYAGRQNYGGVNDVRQRFEGKERDSETDLDYFGARYYRSLHGRFTTVDPLMASGIAIDPQSWNRYVYVGNNPLRYSDDEGLVRRDKYGNVIFDSAGTNQRIYEHPSGERGMVQDGYIYADDGTRIQAMRPIDGGNYKLETDCHGLTFADGSVWVDNDQVETLLSADGYKKIDSKSGLKPQVGDVVVYKQGGQVVHSMTVTAVDDQGKVTAVSGIAGVQDEAKTTTPEQGWVDPQHPNAKITATYYHKEKDKRTPEQRQRQLERTKTYNKQFNAYMKEAMKKVNKELGPPPPPPKRPKQPKPGNTR